MEVYFVFNKGRIGRLNPKILTKIDWFGDEDQKIIEIHIPFNDVSDFILVTDSFLKGDDIDLFLSEISIDRIIAMYNIASNLSYNLFKKKLEEFIVLKSVYPVKDTVADPDDVDRINKKLEDKILQEKLRAEEQRFLEEEQRLLEEDLKRIRDFEKFEEDEKLNRLTVEVYNNNVLCGVLPGSSKIYLSYFITADKINLSLEKNEVRSFVQIFRAYLTNKNFNWPTEEIIGAINVASTLNLINFKGKLIKILEQRTVLNLNKEHLDKINKIFNYAEPVKDFVERYHGQEINNDKWQEIKFELIVNKTKANPSKHFIERIILKDDEDLFSWLVQENLLSEDHKKSLGFFLFKSNSFKIFFLNLFVYKIIQLRHPDQWALNIMKKLKNYVPFIRSYPQIRKGLFKFLIGQIRRPAKLVGYASIFNICKPLSEHKILILLNLKAFDILYLDDIKLSPSYYEIIVNNHWGESKRYIKLLMSKKCYPSDSSFKIFQNKYGNRTNKDNVTRKFILNQKLSSFESNYVNEIGDVYNIDIDGIVNLLKTLPFPIWEEVLPAYLNQILF